MVLVVMVFKTPQELCKLEIVVVLGQQLIVVLYHQVVINMMSKLMIHLDISQILIVEYFAMVCGV